MTKNFRKHIWMYNYIFYNLNLYVFSSLKWAHYGALRACDLTCANTSVTTLLPKMWSTWQINFNILLVEGDVIWHH